MCRFDQLLVDDRGARCVSEIWIRHLGIRKAAEFADHPRLPGRRGKPIDELSAVAALHADDHVAVRDQILGDRL